MRKRVKGYVGGWKVRGQERIKRKTTRRRERKRGKERERESIVQRLTPVHGVIPFFNHHYRPLVPPVLPPLLLALPPLLILVSSTTLYHHNHATRLSSRSPGQRCSYEVLRERRFSCIRWADRNDLGAKFHLDLPLLVSLPDR